MHAAPTDARGGLDDRPGRALRARAKQAAVRATCAGLRLYFRHCPVRAGKLAVWDRVVVPRIAWRTLEIEARTRHGDRLLGGFPDYIHSYVYFFGVWEPGITAYYAQTLREGDVVIDIGANVGTHVLLASRLVGRTGRVHAIEASPTIFARLARNLALNQACNVETHHVAVVEVAGPVPIYLDRGENLGSTTIVPTEAERLRAVQEAVVDGRPLTQIVSPEQIRAARLIKIDVEGAEWLVISGMRAILPLLRADAEILVEVNPEALAQFGVTVAQFLAVFAEAGFAPFEVPNAYGASHYIRQTATPPVALASHEFALADIVFRRPRQTMTPRQTERATEEAC